MRDGPELRTPRLLLRGWRETDRAPFATLNADPEVMAHFPHPLTRDRSDHLVDLIEAEFARNGYGLWAIEVTGTGEFIGFAGLNEVGFAAHFTPAVEVGWRLARKAWGHGYATEAARAALGYGFEVASLAEVVSFTAATNLRSQAVMRRLGMSHDPADDFDHPQLPVRHRLSRHVLYRITPQRFARPGGPG
jgi:RimJ/RimL family protein N-acetyltransferase